MELTDLSKRRSLNNNSTEKYTVIDLDNNGRNLTENNGSNGDNGTLQPGSDIKPQVTVEDVERLSERLYGITIKDIKELISYDDRNYLIHEDRNIKNPLITNNWAHGYILKILNAHDSKKINFVDALNAILLFLRKHDIDCPNPIQNVYGKYYSLENINGTDHVVRLLEYIPGTILHEAPKSNYLFFNTGEYIGKVDRALKEFHHDAYDTHKTLWMLESTPQLRDFIYVLEDHNRKQIVEEIIDAFETKVLSQMGSFEKQVIHGDYNEQNILVTKPKGREDYKVCGLIDFGDTSYSPLVFELAIAMTYMIIQGKDLSVGGLVLAGYTTVKTLQPHEIDVLKECVAARLCQSLVMGAYTYSLHPTNDYVLTTQNAGWELLETLWRGSLETIDELWKTTADNYLKQSCK